MKKKSLLKKLVAPVLIPATKSYLKKDRRSKFLGLDLKIPVGIFHPSLFFSTKTMGKFILNHPIKNTKLLEIGCGSGALSLLAFKAGANVFASDINPLAIQTSKTNAKRNNATIHVIQSNLFDSIQETNFDFIINNPPYYPKQPKNFEEHAWYAGEDYAYFKQLFGNAQKHLNENGTIFLVLSDDCDIDRINEIAVSENFAFKVVYSRTNLLEKTYIIQYKKPIIDQ